MLKSVDEVLYGETNQNPPFWGGIKGITKILDQFLTKIPELRSLEDVILLKKMTLMVKQLLLRVI